MSLVDRDSLQKNQILNGAALAYVVVLLPHQLERRDGLEAPSMASAWLRVGLQVEGL